MSRKVQVILALVLVISGGAALPAFACNQYCQGCECRFSMGTTNMWCDTFWGCCFEVQAENCFAPGDDPEGAGLFDLEPATEPILACSGDAAPASVASDSAGAPAGPGAV